MNLEIISIVLLCFLWIITMLLLNYVLTKVQELRKQLKELRSYFEHVTKHRL